MQQDEKQEIQFQVLGGSREPGHVTGWLVDCPLGREEVLTSIKPGFLSNYEEWPKSYKVIHDVDGVAFFMLS